MPEQQRASWFSSSIVVFLLLSSICAILSLSSPSARTEEIKLQEYHAHNSSDDGGKNKQKILVSEYVPNLAMLCVMVLGITAMVILVIKRDDLTTRDHDYYSNSRHNIHRKASLWSITAFFVGASIFHINYLIVEISCVSKWNHCGSDVILSNSVQVVFQIVCLLFIGCETIICWIMKPLNFKSSLKVWYGLALVQAANFAIWFDSILEESGHRANENVGSFEAYFDFCDTTISNHTETTSEWCSKNSIKAQWFVLSIPFLFPITIEFSLLVSETFLDKIIGSECEHENEATENSSESTPLLSRVTTFLRSTYSTIMSNRWYIIADQNENPNAENVPAFRNTTGSKIFIMISGIINVVYLLLVALVFLGYKIHNNSEIDDEWQKIEDGLTVYSLLYLLFLSGCCVVGILYFQTFRYQHSPTTFLEYLLLFATSGLLLHSLKRLLVFTFPNLGGWNAVYFILEIVDMIQVILQIVFYYYAKGVKLQLNNDGENADNSTKVVFFKNIMIVMSISNFAMWICNNFFNPEMEAHVTPSKYSIEHWTVFDNVVTPIAIFFRFNSALLFWCIGRNIRLLVGN